MFNLKYDQKRIRKYHYFLLLSLIQKHKNISRTQLAKITKMSNTTVGKIINELIDDELILEIGNTVGDAGRRAKLLTINSKGAYIIAVEIDLEYTNIALVALNGTILSSLQINLNANQNPNTVMDIIIKNIKLLMTKFQPEIKEKILAIGIGLPGLITWPKGEVLVVPQFHWKDVKVKSYIEARLDYIVYIDTDVRTALLAESLFGNMTQYDNSACIYVGSGVGGAVMMNGEILRGHHNMLGEIGHITIDPDGALCDCGRLGCLQTFFCSSDLEKKAQMPINEIFQAYDREELWAKRLIEQARKYLALTIANISCIYNPEAVLLTGPMIWKYPQLSDGIENLAQTYAWSALKTSYKIVKPSETRNNGIIGASAIVLNEFLRFTNDDINNFDF
ncbi:ROK family transcriptional regulator [Oceanobacillus neutriphilus]|uniref:Serine/threonine protein kinase n=1 Tax=Oceanobacillus neutriphilus TaxID=531815 RepID=A0ABQ2NWG8_9BACI|nr:ROK family transcriptional regulator [Oceanobacillus neutriphilus]GGP12064.1 serine/threonine protein kinase [Oceanobacillus neutriphilus]